MTPEVQSAIRSLLIALGGFAVGHGWIDSTGLESIVGGLVTLAVTIWGIYAKRPASTEAQTVSKNVLAAGGPSK